jgi:tripartite-type tricarboxylate transporter receptor subunit TctC
VGRNVIGRISNWFLVLLLLMSAARAADDYPSKPIRLVVPVTAGSGLDVRARSLAQLLGEHFGWRVVVDNRPGAGQSIGIGVVAHAAADGYSIGVVNNNLTLNPYLYANPGYDLFKQLAPISQTNIAPLVLVVNPSSEIRTAKQLVAMAKNKPGEMSYASSGVGSTPFITAELFNQIAGIATLHVPFKGDAQSLAEIMAGRIDFSFAGIPSSRPLIEAGKVRALAVTTKTRTPILGNVPTLAEAGFPSYEYAVYVGILAPAATPKPIVQKLSNALRQVLRLPEVQQEQRNLGGEPVGSTPEEFAAFLRAQYKRDGDIVKAIGLKPE